MLVHALETLEEAKRCQAPT